MKKNTFSIFLAVFLVIFLVNSHSQIEIKPTIGLNFTSFSEDPVTGKTSANVGWQLGATLSGGEKFYWEGGVLWVYKSNTYTVDTTKIEFDTKLSGIRIPVSVGYHLLGEETGLIGLRIFGGGSVFIVTTTEAQGASKDDFVSPTYGVFAGAGVDIAIFFLDLQYEWSLSDVVNVTNFSLGKSRSFFINGGIRLSF